MKLMLLFTTLNLVNCWASIYSQKVTLNFQDVKLGEVIEELSRQTNIDFAYSKDFIDLEQTVNIKVKDTDLKNVLDLLLTNRKLIHFELNGKIYLGPGNHYQDINNKAEQQYTVKGRITDMNTGEPLPGVNVTIENTSKGVITDLEGKYSIEVPNAASVLVFSYIGYLTEEITVGDQTVINVQLVPDITEMDEVVVVGYGTQKKYSVVGSITSIQPQKLQMGTTRSLSNNLAGQLSGIIAVQRSGEPGYDNSTFWIRGISTFASTRYPLVLVDGIERSLDNIDPAEIESFSILKDASATAVYGVRGANGVILINTKRGKVGKPAINVRFEQGFTQPVKLPDFLGAADYLEVLNAISEDEGKPLLYDQEYIDNTRKGEDPDLYPDVNWLDAITKDHASNSRLNLTVSGGTEMLRYSLVGSYYNELGIIETDPEQEWDSSMKLNRYNVRSNIDINVTRSTLFRVNIGGYLQDDTRPPQSIDNLFSKAFETPPHKHPTQYSSGEIPVVPARTNPWALATQTGYTRSSASKIESLFSLEQDLKSLTPGLKAKVNFSFDRYSKTSVKRDKTPDYYNPAIGRNEDGTLDLVIFQYGQEFLGYSKESEWGNNSIYLEGNISYTENFGNHYVDGLFLYNQRSYDDGSKLPYRNQGIAGRFSYSFARRYIAEFNFGYNGSENFAKGHRFGFFPSVAVGWLMSEEKFMQPYNDLFSKIKFRGSYGLVGNDRIDGRRFAYITTIGDTDGYRWGVNNDYHRAGRREGDYGVSNLTWETVAKANVGIELGLWHSIELQVDLFEEERTDIFMQRKTVPGSAGFVQTPWANYGKVNNQGIDISMDINRQITSDFFLSARGTFTYAVNEIIEQDEPKAVVGTPRSSTGRPVGQIFGYIAEGLFTDEDFADIENGVLVESLPTQEFGPVQPGDIKYRDLNGDGTITELDKTAIGGTADPEIVYGFGVNMRYKSVDLGIFCQGNGKTYRILGGTAFIPGSNSGALGNIYSNVYDRWTVDNPSQDVFWPRLSGSLNENNTQASTWWLKDMSMLRVKYIELGYNLPETFIQKAGMEGARIFIKGDNLLTFSSFDLWDPELDTSNGFRYPIMKSFSFGVDITF